MEISKEFLGYLETHDTTSIRGCLAQGLDPNSEFKGKPLIFELISGYTRSPAFKDCLRAFVDYGLRMDDVTLHSAPSVISSLNY